MASVTSNQSKAHWKGWRSESAETVAKYESLLNAVSAEPESDLARLLNANAPEQIITQQLFIEARAAMVSKIITPGLWWMKQQMDEQSVQGTREYEEGSIGSWISDANKQLDETSNKESFLPGALDVTQAALQGDFTTAKKVANETPGMQVHTSD